MILLLGGSGYIGKAFQRFFEKHNVSFQSVSRAVSGYDHEDRLIELLRATRPSFVINAAGYTGLPNVDACELHKTECLLANAVLPGVIRRACEHVGVPWGHVSSGCVYTGSKADGSGFTEDDPPNFDFRHNNSSFYSGSKALGEELLADAETCYVWRPRMPFNHIDHPRNYP